MPSNWVKTGIAVALIVAANPLAGQATDVSGFIGVESLSFTRRGQGPEQINRVVGEFRARSDLTNTLSYDLRLYGSKNIGGADSGYLDPTVAKLTWHRGNWEVVLGSDLVFWGVAESRNVVNFVNQRDQIRDIMNDQGLGQQMVALRHFGSSFTVEGFILPGFRELDFGADGRRWGLGMPVDDSRSTFESKSGRWNVDYALRLSGTVDDLEYGLSAFNGTLRQPEFRFDAETSSLIPHYGQGQYFGLDLQYTQGSSLLKFEGNYLASNENEDYLALVYGIEYVLGSAFGMGWETTLFAEHNLDSRDNDAPSVYQNDLFVGTRINFANANDTELRFGTMIDMDYGGILGSIRLNTRLAGQMRLETEYIFVNSDDPSDALDTAQDFDQILVKLQWHF